MPAKNLYASDFYSIEIDTEQNILRSRWLRSVNCEEMVTGGTKLYESLLDTGAELVVANAQLLCNLDTETKEWMSSGFYELLSLTRLRRIARVLPANVFSKIALESVATRAEASGAAKFSFRNFVDQQEAEKWLLS
ncbi:hypothetical protein [Pontibacter russatus]|uniref:hypothetical protein n=1 Tax=Pontibacter russatus TaxID=2694929 RepID=UPI00137A6FA2|nr:hypothetical protein [Pontibacter russatus]